MNPNRPLKYLSSLLGLLAVVLTPAAADINWLSDFSIAKTESQNRKKYLLMEFTGSDWCPPCKALAEEVLEKKPFASFAEEHLVLLKIDFPKKKPLTADQKKYNQQLAEKYRVEAFPTLIILDLNGQEVARETGYSGSPDEVLAWLKKHVSKPKL